VSTRHLIHVVSIILLALTAALALTGVVSLAHGEAASLAFAGSTVVCLALGLVGYRRTSLDRDLTIREGYAVVSLSWIAIGVVGALPYLFTGVLTSPAAALFESVSGFTTTGATVFNDIESLPRGILFWRSLTQWIGGMGIIVLGIAILPFLGIGGMQLFRAEVPGPTPERLQPRIAQTAKLLWYVYAGLTVLQIVLLLLAGMSWFDAVNHALATVSTGGFSPRNASIAFYESGVIQYIVILFMYLAALNFTLHYRALLGAPGRYLKDTEWRAFTYILIAATAIVAFSGWRSGLHAGDSAEHLVRDALFQVISIATTTGFVTFDYDRWPAAANLVLLVLMLIGGMAGSTAGGMKVIRVYALVRQSITALKRSLHPRAVVVTRVGTRIIRDDDLLNILAFILLYISLLAAGALVMALLGHDILTSVGASAATIGNVGPGLGDVGAIENYGWMGPVSHLMLVFLMLVGRLEIFTVLLLFHPDLWRGRT
jgi:trk system potassium uptake protein